MYANNKTAKILSVLCTAFIVLAVFIYLMPKFYLPIIFGWQYKVFNSKPKMLLVWRHGLGERELGERILKVMPTLGVNVKFICAARGGTTIYDRHIPNKLAVAIKYMRPDFVLTIDRAVPPIHGITNFVVLDQSLATYIAYDANNKADFIQPYHYQFTGLLPAFKEIEILKQVYEQQGKTYKGFAWRPTVQSTDFKFQGAKRVFFAGGALTDVTRGSDKYKQVFAQLDKMGYLDVYGYPEKWQHTPNSLRGFIPIDGISLIKINNAAGVSLILHDRQHLDSGTPTGRIFESAAANTLIISDKNAFIQEHFGANVLYVDVETSALELFRQIDRHVQWALTHPEQAQQMANNCHAIFLEKFTLEQQMRALVDLALKS